MTIRGSWRRVHRQHVVAAITSMAVLASVLGVAHAATLGNVSSEQVTAYDVNQRPVIVTTTTLPPTTTTTLPPTTTTSLPPTTTTTTPPPPPVTLGCDTFSLPASTGKNLGGRPVQPPATCGTAQWKIHAGNWNINNGELSGVNNEANAVIPAGQTDMTVEATILNANGGARIAGVAVSHTGNTKNFVAGILSGPSTAQIRLVNGQTQTTTILASATVTLGQSVKLRTTRQGNLITLSVDGVIVVQVTLTAAQAAVVAGGTNAGVYNTQGNTIRFLNFLVTTPYLP